MAEFTTIARPYAKAAFDFAVESNNVDSWLEMITFMGQVASDDAVVSMLKATTAANEAADLMIKIGGEQLNEHGQNLIKIMAENERLSVLPEVADLFTEYCAEHQKSITADVVSASALTAAQKTKMIKALEKRLERQVKLNCTVDADLLGGVLITAGDLVIDGSVRGKLNRLADALQS